MDTQSTVNEIVNSKADVSAWADEFKQYTNIAKLDRRIITSLIDTVEIGQSEKVNGELQQHISVNYKFVGNLSA